MARRIDYHIGLDISINETERELLRCLRDLTSRPGEPVSMTARGLSERLKTSTATVRRACRALSRKGLILSQDVRREDGSRAANEYVITLVGWEVLRSKGTMRPVRRSGGERGASDSRG